MTKNDKALALPDNDELADLKEKLLQIRGRSQNRALQVVLEYHFRVAEAIYDAEQYSEHRKAKRLGEFMERVADCVGWSVRSLYESMKFRDALDNRFPEFDSSRAIKELVADYSSWNQVRKALDIRDDNTGNEEIAPVQKTDSEYCTHTCQWHEKVTEDTPKADDTKTGEIAEIMALFKPVNHRWEKLMGVKAQRMAIKHLLEFEGMTREKLEGTIKWLASANKMKYSPGIYSPIDLEKKWEKLGTFVARLKEKSPKNKVGVAL